MHEHHWRVDSDEQGEGRRKVTFACNLCGDQMAKVTVRSAREIQAELDAQPEPETP